MARDHCRAAGLCGGLPDVSPAQPLAAEPPGGGVGVGLHGLCPLSAGNRCAGSSAGGGQPTHGRRLHLCLDLPDSGLPLGHRRPGAHPAGPHCGATPGRLRVDDPAGHHDRGVARGPYRRGGSRGGPTPRCRAMAVLGDQGGSQLRRRRRLGDDAQLSPGDGDRLRSGRGAGQCPAAWSHRPGCCGAHRHVCGVLHHRPRLCRAGKDLRAGEDHHDGADPTGLHSRVGSPAEPAPYRPEPSGPGALAGNNRAVRGDSDGGGAFRGADAHRPGMDLHPR